MMKPLRTFTFTQPQTKNLDILLSEFFKEHELDLDHPDEALSYSTMKYFYQRYLPSFKFPKEVNEMEMTDTEMIAFYGLFKDIDNDTKEGKLAFRICKQIANDNGLSDWKISDQGELFL